MSLTFDSQVVYGVVCIRKEDDERYYAVKNSIPALFLRRKDAMDFRDELRKAGLRVDGIFKVRVTFQIVDREVDLWRQ